MNPIVKGVVLALFMLVVGAPRQAAGAMPTPHTSPAAAPSAPALTIQLSTTTIRPGETLTVSVDYTEIRMPYLAFTITPAEAVEFQPAIPEPCKYNEDPTGCRRFTLQAVSTGTVQFRAVANGEIYDDTCQCYRWQNVSSPVVTLTITGTPNFPLPRRAYLPVVGQRTDLVPPQGQLLVTSDRDGGSPEIYQMDAAGSNLQRLTTNTVHDGNAVRSPDGRTIVFESSRDGISDLYLMASDGTNQRQLTTTAASYDPVWSPDGRQIAFQSYHDQNQNPEIHVINADGSNHQRLTTNAGYDGTPTWSADGQTIAFGSTRDGQPTAIYLMARDGTHQRRLLTGYNPVWSPDGQQLAYQVTQDGIPSLYRMRSDGTQQTLVVRNQLFVGKVVWSPDSQMFAFSVQRAGSFKSGVRLISADGSTQRDVLNLRTTNTVSDWIP